MALRNPPLVRQEITAARAQNYAAATDADAVITYAAVAGQSHAITEGIAYSYTSPCPLTSGNLTVAVGGVTVFSVDITEKGQGFFPLRLAARVNEAMTITLADGGASINGKVNVLGYARISGAPIGVNGIFDFGDYLQSGLVATI